MPVRDYETMLAHAVIGEEVCRIIRESGLMVPRQKPGRKAEAVKPAQAIAAPAKPVKTPKPKPVPEPEEDEDDADDESEE